MARAFDGTRTVVGADAGALGHPSHRAAHPAVAGDASRSDTAEHQRTRGRARGDGVRRPRRPPHGSPGDARHAHRGPARSSWPGPSASISDLSATLLDAVQPEDRASLERGLDAVLARLRGLVAESRSRRSERSRRRRRNRDDDRGAHQDRRDRVAAVAGGPDGAADLREHRPRDLPSSGAAGRRLGVRLPPARADDPARLHRAVGDRDPDHRPRRAALAGRVGSSSSSSASGASPGWSVCSART